MSGVVCETFAVLVPWPGPEGEKAGATESGCDPGVLAALPPPVLCAHGGHGQDVVVRGMSLTCATSKGMRSGSGPGENGTIEQTRRVHVRLRRLVLVLLLQHPAKGGGGYMVMTTNNSRSAYSLCTRHIHKQQKCNTSL